MEDINIESQGVLFKLLQDIRDHYHVTCEGGSKFNHLPLSLVELFQLGADPSRLEDFYNKNKSTLDPKVPGTGSITKKNWKDSLGKRVFYSDFREFFERELASKSASYQEKFPGKAYRGLIAEYFPKIMDGLVGDDYHALLMLGHALDLDNADLALDGLAYFCFSYLSLGHIDQLRRFTHPGSNVNVVDDFLSVLKDVTLNHPRNKEYEEAGNSDARLARFVQKEGDFLNHPHTLVRVDSEDVYSVVNRVIEIFIDLYTGTLDDHMLHIAGGGMALRQVLSFLSKQDQLLAAHYYVRSALAMYIVYGQPALICVDPEQFRDEISNLQWNEITKKASQCDNIHAIMFAYLLWKEDEHRFNVMHKIVAGHLVGLVTKKSGRFAKKNKVPILELANKPSYAKAARSQLPAKRPAPAFVEAAQAREEVKAPEEPKQAPRAMVHENVSYAEAVKENLTPEKLEESKESDRKAEQRGEPIAPEVQRQLEQQPFMVQEEEEEPEEQIHPEHKRYEESPFLEPSEQELPHKRQRMPSATETVKAAAQEFAEQSRETVAQAKQQVAKTIPAVVEKSREVLDEANKRVKGLSQDINQAVNEASQRALDLSAELKDKSRGIAQQTKDKVVNKAQDLVDQTQRVAGEVKGFVKGSTQQLKQSTSNAVDRSRDYVKDTTHQLVDRSSALADRTLERAGIPPQEFKPKVKKLGFTLQDIFYNLFSWATLFYFVMLPFKIYYNMAMIPFRAFNVLLLRPLRTRAVPVIREKAGEVPRAVHNLRMHEARAQVREMSEQVKRNIEQQEQEEEQPLRTRTVRYEVKQVKVKKQGSDAEQILQNIDKLRVELERPTSIIQG